MSDLRWIHQTSKYDCFRLDLPIDLAVELSKHPNIVGKDCEKCKIKTYDYPNCQGMFWFLISINASINHIITKTNFISDCGCDPEGSASEFCDEVTGICPCKPHVTGPKCPKCEFGYYNFPDCIRMYNVMPVHSLKNSHHFQSQTCEWSDRSDSDSFLLWFWSVLYRPLSRSDHSPSCVTDLIWLRS